MITHIIGIDLGLHGAITDMTQDGITSYAMPTCGKDIDITEINTFLRTYVSEDTVVVFERIGLIFKSSKTTAFSMGKQLGAMEALCISRKIPHEIIPPKEWQKAIFQGIPEIKKGDSRDTKAMALVAVRRLFPSAILTVGKRATKPHDGVVDSILLAEYARRKLQIQWNK